MIEITLGELAQVIGAELEGDPSVKITRLAPINLAQSGCLTFLDKEDKRYRQFLPDTKASAIILAKNLAERSPINTLLVDNPKLAFVKATELFFPSKKAAPGIHKTATISSENTKIASTASIGANCVIEENVTIGEHTTIQAGSYIGANTTIGNNCYFWPNVTIYGNTQIGNQVFIHSGAVIASDGFGLVQDQGRWQKVPQVGRVIIEDDVEIGANTTIDRGALDDTVIGQGVKIDNQVQIAHNVKIGAHTVIAGCVGIAGSAKIGKYCMIGGAACIAGHLEITDHVYLTAMIGVAKSILKPGLYASGISFKEHPEWRRNASKFYKLADMDERIKKLEKIVNLEESTE